MIDADDTPIVRESVTVAARAFWLSGRFERVVLHQADGQVWGEFLGLDMRPSEYSGRNRLLDAIALGVVYEVVAFDEDEATAWAGCDRFSPKAEFDALYRIVYGTSPDRGLFTADDYLAEALDTAERHAVDVEAVAQALLDRRELTSAEVWDIAKAARRAYLAAM